MNQKVKGNYGYITYKKKTSLGMALLMVLIGLGIFVVGLLLNKMSGRNVFSIFGMLMVLPMAKYLTTYIVAGDAAAMMIAEASSPTSNPR